MINKALLLILSCLLSVPTLASAALKKGPYIQAVDTQSAIVCFEADAQVWATVEVGEDDSYGEAFHGFGDAFTHDGTTVYQYKIEIPNRVAGTVYHYRVTHGESTTPDYFFTTEPNALEPFRFVVMGDSRGGSIGAPNLNHEAIVDAIVEETPEFYFNTGDLVSDGAVLDDWAYLFEADKELLPFIPLYPVFGNHESSFEGGLSGDKNWKRLFETPNYEDHPTYYSFDYVNVHFIVIDIEKWYTLALPGVGQNQWLRDDLDAYQANPLTNFVFVFYHEPPFSWKDGRTGHPLAQLVLQPLFIEYGVDAVFAGHDHFYAHANMGGIDNYVTGGGGAGLYDFQTTPDFTNFASYVAHDQSYHYIVIDVQPEQAELRVFRLDGTLIDSKVYEKDPPQWPTDDDTGDDDTVDDDTVDDDTADDDTVDDDVADDDQIDDDAADDDQVDDDAVDDNQTDDDQAADDDDDDDDGCGC